MAKNILIGICGSVAAFKIPSLLRLLTKRGDRVQVVLTPAAADFVSPLVLQALSGRPVLGLADPGTRAGAMAHIELARWADVFLLAPLSANTAAKLAQGLGDNLLTTLYLATTAPVLLAPAMNPQMWQHPAVRANFELLRQRHYVLEPNCGDHACGEEGQGRLVEPEELLAAIDRALPASRSGEALRGQRVVITAGATVEHIDPVRYLSNHSSGKMAFALAQEAARRGAEVTVIAGQTSAPEPENVRILRVKSALEMLALCETEALPCDVFIGCAAVADYRVKNPLRQKHKKALHGQLTLELVENPDIIKTIATGSPRPRLCVGFSAETEALQSNARRKLQDKQLDVIVANDVSQPVFGDDSNAVSVLDSNGQRQDFPRQSKIALAGHIWDYLIARQEDKNS